MEANEGHFQWCRSGADPHRGYQIAVHYTNGLYTFADPLSLPGNGYARWLLNQAPRPDPESSMNCTEVIFLAAEEQRAVSLEQLQGLYARAAQQGQLHGDTLRGFHGVIWDALHYRSARSLAPRGAVRRGDLVIFFDGVGAPCHAGVALGRTLAGQPLLADLMGTRGEGIQIRTVEQGVAYRRSLNIATSDVRIARAPWDPTSPL